MHSRFFQYLQSCLPDNNHRSDHTRAITATTATTTQTTKNGARDDSLTNNENIRIGRKRCLDTNFQTSLFENKFKCSPSKIARNKQSIHSFEFINVSDDESDLKNPQKQNNRQNLQRNPLKMNQNSNRVTKKIEDTAGATIITTDTDPDLKIVKVYDQKTKNGATKTSDSDFDRVKNMPDMEKWRNKRRIENCLASLRTSARPVLNSTLFTSRTLMMPRQPEIMTLWRPVSTKNDISETSDSKMYRKRIWEFTRNFFQKTSRDTNNLNRKPIATIDLTAADAEDDDEIQMLGETVATASDRPKTEAEKECEKCTKLTESVRQKSLEQREEIERDAAQRKSEIRLQHDHNTQIWSNSLENDLLRLTIKKKEFIDDLTPTISDSEVIEVPVLPKIPDELRQMVTNVFRGFNDKEVIVKRNNNSITRHDLKTLQPRGWLNDEIINYYLNLIQIRNETKQLRSVHTMNTFFLIRYQSSGYSSVRRWTKNVDIFSKDFFIVPVHLGCHWCIITVDMTKKQCFFYDSMLVNRAEFVQLIRNYLIEEHRNKKQSELNVTEWKFAQNFDIPKQTNSWDCGVFSCVFAEFVTRDLHLNSASFSESDMDYFRMKMAAEILEGELFT